MGISSEGKDIYQLAHEVTEMALNDFGKPFGTLTIPQAHRTTEERMEQNKIVPRDRQGSLLPSCMPLIWGVRLMRKYDQSGNEKSLTDGWGGSYIGTEFSDILFGTPVPREIEANLGVIEITW
jgi:carbon-monoxide dehydrogenase catalytic subunit